MLFLSDTFFILSHRTKVQQQSSQLEELERQKAEIADLHQVRHNQPTIKSYLDTKQTKRNKTNNGSFYACSNNYCLFDTTAKPGTWCADGGAVSL